MTNWGCPITPAVWEAAPLQLPCPDRNMEGSLGQDLNVPIYKQPWNKSRRKQDLFLFFQMLLAHNQRYKSQGHPARSKCKALTALLGGSGLTGGHVWAGGPGSALFFPCHGATLWHSSALLKIALAPPRHRRVGGCARLQLDFHPRTKAAVLPGVGMESGARGWAGCVCACMCVKLLL